MKPVSILLCWLSLAGCYRHVPVEGTLVANGTRVVVELTASGTARLQSSLGNFVTRVEGDVEESTSSGMTLALVAVRRRGEVGPSTWTGERIQLATTDIARLRRTEFSRRRTAVAWVAIGSVSVGVVYAIARATGLVSGTTGGKTPPPP